jgi:VIT1/CCC1 family predicted Fe2+/Mn2+ transporter
MGVDNGEIIADANRFYNNELNDAALYDALMRMEGDQDFRGKLGEISKMEEGHAEFWKGFLERRGHTPRTRRRGAFMGLVRLLKTVFGSALVASLFELGESSAVSSYSTFLETFDMDEEERASMKRIILDELEHESAFSESKEFLKIGNLRDFILGMNDGLVEILGAVTGLSAVYTRNPFMVALSGVIIGVAGSLSMGIGAFISVRSQRQVNEGIRNRMELIFRVSEDRAKEELREKLVSANLPEEIAADVVDRLAGEEDAVMRLLVEENQEDEVRAAIYTGLAYIIGVFFPVVPYFFSSSSLTALPFSIALAGSVLAVMAVVISLISGIPVRKKVAEMVVTGLGAAGLTYVIGFMIQSTFGLAI